jgi:hypothetical protein
LCAAAATESEEDGDGQKRAGQEVAGRPVQGHGCLSLEGFGADGKMVTPPRTRRKRMETAAWAGDRVPAGPVPGVSGIASAPSPGSSSALGGGPRRRCPPS